MPFTWIDSNDIKSFENFEVPYLNIDEAYLTIENNNFKNESYFYSVYKQCIKCPYTQENIPLSNGSTSIVNTRFAKTWRILSKNPTYSFYNSLDNVLCEIDPQLGQFGIYKLKLRENSSCELETLKESVNIYTPMVTVTLIYFLIFLLVYSFIKVCHIWFKLSENNKKINISRVQSIDTFRGISIILMIFVNYGCGGYEILDHAIWNGLHVADIVFPWFIWIMGFCIPLSITSARTRGIKANDLIKTIIKRSCKLFIIGFILSSPISLNIIRIPGVLQRFGGCYFVVTTSFLFLTNENTEETKDNKITKDICKIKYVWLVGILFLILNLLLSFLVSTSNCPSGYLGPGGLHENTKYFDCTGGAAGYIDELIFGKHIYQKPETREIFKSKAFDPEGILGFFTSIFHVIIGLQGGVTLQTYKTHKDRLIRWFGWGTVLGLVGGILCGFSKENGIIPVNKYLWSISFVCVTCSFSFILLCILYFVIDVKKIWNGKPFSFCGMNAILLYIGHNMTYSIFPIRWTPDGGLGNHFIALTANVWGVFMWTLIAYYCYKIKYFLTV